MTKPIKTYTLNAAHILKDGKREPLPEPKLPQFEDEDRVVARARNLSSISVNITISGLKRLLMPNSIETRYEWLMKRIRSKN